MRIFCRSESFLGDKSLRGLAGSGSTHWYERDMGTPRNLMEVKSGCYHSTE